MARFQKNSSIATKRMLFKKKVLAYRPRRHAPSTRHAGMKFETQQRLFDVAFSGPVGKVTQMTGQVQTGNPGRGRASHLSTSVHSVFRFSGFWQTEGNKRDKSEKRVRSANSD